VALSILPTINWQTELLVILTDLNGNTMLPTDSSTLENKNTEAPLSQIWRTFQNGLMHAEKDQYL
jgi:hypothetical protein